MKWGSAPLAANLDGNDSPALKNKPCRPPHVSASLAGADVALGPVRAQHWDVILRPHCYCRAGGSDEAGTGELTRRKRR
jgi:hypothetical protein